MQQPSASIRATTPTGGGHRVALGHRRQVLQPVQPLELEPPLSVVEARSVDAAAPAGLGDMPNHSASSSTINRRCASFPFASLAVTFGI
jgi:hypothetical protein